MPVAVVIERGRRRVFASATEWPGWCRSARSEEAALEALAAYRDRYAAVPAAAGVRFVGARPSFDVLERVAGDATTDFGAPGAVTDADRAPLGVRPARRMADLLEAAWSVLDAVARSAPATLRKGPRGGGRDRDQIVAHVLNAEAAYARKLGVREADPARRRRVLAEVLGRASGGAPAVAKGWPPRYVARRTAWHVLDHAWEMEDRSAGP